MARFDFNKTFSQTGDSIKQLSIYNPLKIHRQGTRSKAIFALILVCFFWGLTWLASREAVRKMPGQFYPLQIVSIRQLIAGFCYVLFFMIKGVKLPRGKEWRPILMLSFVNFILSNALSTWGVKYISSGLGSIIGATFPLWLVVIGLFASRNKIPTRAILGLLLGLCGVCTIFYEHLKDFLIVDFQFGVAISLISTWSWAFGTLYIKQQAVNFNPYFSLGLQMLISGMAFFVFTNVTGNALPITEIPWESWVAIGFLLVFGSFIAFIAYIYALQNLPTEQVSIYAYVNPIVAVLAGWIIYHETISAFIIFGGLITLFGIYMVNRAFKTMPPPAQPEAEGV